MRKVFIILLLICCFFCLSCKRHINYEIQREVVETSMNPTQILEEKSHIYYGKSFVGGTGFTIDGEDLSHYDYAGGSMDIIVDIDNEGYEWECGVFLIIDGVFQSFALYSDSLSQRDYSFLHIINIEENSNMHLTLSFTPNTGKAGDILNIIVGTMYYPSYTTEYDGFARYGRFNPHALSALSGETIHMLVDAPLSQQSARLETEYVEIPTVYKTQLSTANNDLQLQKRLLQGTFFKLYSDFDTVIEQKNILIVPSNENVNITFDVFGKANDYRASLFINNELICVDDYGTFFDFSIKDDYVTRITLAVDTTCYERNNHIYLILFDKANNNPFVPDGQYVYCDKTDTHFFIVEESSINEY